MKDWKAWYLSMTAQEKAAYAVRADVSRGYIEVHLLNRRRNPSLKVINRLADASLGRFTVEDMVRFFLQPKPTEAA